jgi:hypothetical protein
MHYQTRSWARLTSVDRDARLNELGISNEELVRIRSNEPRERILEAARVAQVIDDEPNSDLIEYIAGYALRGALYHHFGSTAELYGSLGILKKPSPLRAMTLPRSHLDLATTVPTGLAGTTVHMDDLEEGRRVRVWQKLNGGMRSVILNRDVRRMLFLAGVVLYAGEGTKSLKSGRVEVANSNPAVLRLHIRFIEGFGFSKNALRARVQIHAPTEELEAQDFWSKELGLSPVQFMKPLLSKPADPDARRTFTLQLSYSNMMLLMLLRYWTDNIDVLTQALDVD